MCDEKMRVMALKSYRILDTPSDEHLDLLTQLTARFCEVPVALISLVDKHRQWAKSISGVRIYEETPREMSFCDLAIGGDKIFEVTNTEENDQLRGNPLVTASPHIRFYAGAPLITPSGHKIGALCVLDMVPRQLTSKQRSALLEMSRLVMQRFDTRKEMNLLKDSELQLADLIENTSDLIQSVSPEGLILFANQTWLDTLGYTKSDLPSLNIFEVTLVLP
ncbi:MAG: PAS domain S-box protein [Verrucomicrobia bacterium]|nr:PAS domain S-box protein [Verrucomicrobiota bacterium]